MDVSFRHKDPHASRAPRMPHRWARTAVLLIEVLLIAVVLGNDPPILDRVFLFLAICAGALAFLYWPD